jgi:Na+-transporting NADH:ubiquinone oxidoreductase subunit B
MTDSLPLHLSSLKRTPGAPHIRNSLSVNGIVLLYIAASIPCLMLGIWQAGSRWAGLDASVTEVLAAGLLLVGPRLIVLLGLGFGLSKLYEKMRNRRSDLGWLGVSWFFFLLLPPAIDFIPMMLALTFGLVFVLFVFGGQGMAPFHPALGAIIFLNVAFGDTGESIEVAPDTFVVSSWYSALDSRVSEGFDFGILSLQTGNLGAMSPALVILGGLLLALMGVASYRILIGGIAGAAVASLLLNASGHLLAGNFLFVLVFLGSDPACQPLTRPARWFAGFAFGSLTILLRVLDPAHPESSFMALLLVSLCSPVVDAAVVRIAAWRRSKRHHG